MGRERPTSWDPKEKRRKLSTNEKALTELIRKYPTDPLYPMILEYRDVSKIAGTYIGYYEETLDAN
jgi:DNA polymerase I-like protein with 3'-5' exonuclease and polymerase domains